MSNKDSPSHQKGMKAARRAGRKRPRHKGRKRPQRPPAELQSQRTHKPLYPADLARPRRGNEAQSGGPLDHQQR